MTHTSTYQAAFKVAATVEQHFAKQIANARANAEINVAPAPSANIIEQIIDVAFWASLRKEEGKSPRISLAFLPPSQAEKPLMFEHQLPVTPALLNKISPGVERAGIHIGVWCDVNGLYIWGTTQTIPNFCFVLDVSEPGLLVIKHRRVYGLGKFTNVAVLKGDEVKIVDEGCAALPDSPAIIKSLLGYNSPSAWNDSVNVFIQLAVSMRAHGHGGSLLIVPACTTAWRESIIHPIKYAVQPSFSALADLIRSDGTDKSDIFWKSALSREVENIAGLTAIDGATIISDRHELLAFGAKIGRSDGHGRVEKVSLTEPIVGGEAVIVHPAQSGGTRHLSGAQFVHDQRDAISMIASQDGHFTVYSWSPFLNMVQAHRIDTLLL